MNECMNEWGKFSWEQMYIKMLQVWNQVAEIYEYIPDLKLLCTERLKTLHQAKNITSFI